MRLDLPVTRFSWGGEGIERRLGDIGQAVEDAGSHTAVVSLRDVETPIRTIEAIGREVIPRARKLGPSFGAPRTAAA